MSELVKRSDAVNELIKYRDSLPTPIGYYDNGFNDGLSHAINYIGLISPVETSDEAIKGGWIKASGMAPPEFAGKCTCSNCGEYALMSVPYGNRQILSDFCPWCGADMRGEKHE